MYLKMYFFYGRNYIKKKQGYTLYTLYNFVNYYSPNTKNHCKSYICFQCAHFKNIHEFHNARQTYNISQTKFLHSNDIVLKILYCFANYHYRILSNLNRFYLEIKSSR